MRVTVREAAKLLNTTEEQIYDWIEEKNLPAYKMNDQYRINRSELLEWATEKKISVAPVLFQQAEDEDNIPGVAECLRRGGVHPAIAGTTREEVLRSALQALQLADEEEGEMLLQMLLARESLGTTSVGDGIAIPHVRNPVVLSTDEPLLALCFLSSSADFESIDGKRIEILFLLVCPTIHMHLQMLAKLAYLLQIGEFRELVLQKKSGQEIMAAAERLEART